MTRLIERLSAWLGASQTEADPAAAPCEKPGLRPDDPRLPDAAKLRVARLVALAVDVEERARGDALLAAALVEVRQMRHQHLPRLVASYAEIPAAHRAEVFRRTGRSASYDLNSALDHMIARMESLSRSLAQGDIDSFSDNLRFIEDRYGDEGRSG